MKQFTSQQKIEVSVSFSRTLQLFNGFQTLSNKLLCFNSVAYSCISMTISKHPRQLLAKVRERSLIFFNFLTCHEDQISLIKLIYEVINLVQLLVFKKDCCQIIDCFSTYNLFKFQFPSLIDQVFKNDICMVLQYVQITLIYRLYL